MNKPTKKHEKEKKGLFEQKITLVYDPKLDGKDGGPAVRRRTEEINHILKNSKLPW
jgi:hypothetical protein